MAAQGHKAVSPDRTTSTRRWPRMGGSVGIDVIIDVRPVFLDSDFGRGSLVIVEHRH